MFIKLKEVMYKGRINEKFTTPMTLITYKGSQEIRWIIWSISYNSSNNHLSFLAGSNKDKKQNMYVDELTVSNFKITNFKNFK